MWAEAEEALRSYGVRCARAACQKARRNGCTPEHVLGLVAHARLHDQGGVRRWDSGGLWSRVANADPQLSVADGWLSDRDAWTRATRDQALACQRRRDARASPTWEQAEAAVERQGVGDWRGACDAARSLGLSPGEVIAAAEYFAAHRQWFRGAGALFWKLTKTKPGRPVADDWPIPSEEAIAAQRREEQLARQDWMERLRLLSAAELRDLVSWAEAELGDVLLASQCDPLGEGECLVCAQSLDGLIRAFRARESGRFV